MVSYYRRKQGLASILKEATREATRNRDQLGKAAFFLLHGHIETNQESRDFHFSRGYIALAIFCKRKHFFEDASKYYELASEIMAKNPKTQKNSKLQMANSLNCRATAAVINKKFGDASSYLEQASKIFKELGKPKEATYCESKRLEYHAKEFEFIEDYQKASNLMSEAGKKIYKNDEKLGKSYQAWSIQLLGKHFRKQESNEKAAKHFEDAAEIYKEIGNNNAESICRAEASFSTALMLKYSPQHDYKTIAQKFKEAADEFEKIPAFREISHICKGDYFKNLALDARLKGEREEAENLFTKSKAFYYEVMRRTQSERRRQFVRSSVLWCEGMAAASKAEEMLLQNISAKRKMEEVLNLLAQSSSYLSRAGDYKLAHAISGLSHFAMAIDAFHDGDIPKATSFVREAKSSIPKIFLHSVMDSEVHGGWEPLRYALGMLESFDKYALRLDKEKGYSFESRARDLLRKMFSQFDTIEEKTFNPKDDEIGIVFKDRTPIEIDALGEKKGDNKLLLLVGEAKNISKPVSYREAIKFLKKIRFVEKRYGKIADLQCMRKPEITEKVFISTSELIPAAKDVLVKNNVKVFEGDQIDKLFKNFHLPSLPKKN